MTGEGRRLDQRVHDVGMAIVGLEAAEISEGQAVKATGLGRVEVRALQDALRALLHGLQVDGGHHKQHDIRLALIALLGEEGEEQLRAWLDYEKGIPA